MAPTSFLTSQLCRPAALIQLHTLSCATLCYANDRYDTYYRYYCVEGGYRRSSVRYILGDAGAIVHSTMAMRILRIRAIMTACRGNAAKGAAIPLSSYTSLSYHYTSYNTYEELYHRCVIAYRRRSISHFAIVLSDPRFVSGESSPVPLFRAIG